MQLQSILLIIDSFHLNLQDLDIISTPFYGTILCFSLFILIFVVTHGNTCIIFNLLKIIFSTHHHGDHDGGNAPLLRLYPELKIYATDERVNAYTHMLNHLTKFSLCGLEIRTLHTPCHTTGTIILLRKYKQKPF